MNSRYQKQTSKYRDSYFTEKENDLLSKDSGHGTEMKKKRTRDLYLHLLT